MNHIKLATNEYKHIFCYPVYSSTIPNPPSPTILHIHWVLAGGMVCSVLSASSSSYQSKIAKILQHSWNHTSKEGRTFRMTTTQQLWFKYHTKIKAAKRHTIHPLCHTQKPCSISFKQQASQHSLPAEFSTHLTLSHISSQFHLIILYPQT